jgi:peptidoglycan/LPS O-acetylase OafA/YrhL
MDPMRAIAAIAVVGFHVGNSFGVADEATALRRYAGRLNVGVWIFFVISGFLLYRPYVTSRMSGLRSPTLAGYAWRRFLRIFPAYWVALTVFTVSLSIGGVFTVANAPRLYLLVQNYWSSTFGGGLGQAWSLSVELTFYVVLGLLALGLSRLAARRGRTSLSFELGVVLALIASGVAFRWLALQLLLARPGAYLPWYIDAFAAGMLLAVLSAHFELAAEKPWWIKAIERFPLLPWAIGLLGYWIVATQIGLSGDYRQPLTNGQNMLETALYTAIAVCVVLPAVWGDHRQGLTRRLLATRPLQYIGKVSYGVFLYEGLVIIELLRWGLRSVTAPHLSYLISFAATLAGSLLLGSISWYVVEAPALRRKSLVAAAPPAANPAPRKVEPLARDPLLR